MPSVLFSGHMVDAPDRPEPRFPPERVPAVRLQVAATVAAIEEHDAVGISGLACGSDLIFAELWLATGRSLLGHLARPVEDFLDESVRWAGPHWVAAFDRVVGHPATTVVEPSDEMLGLENPHALNNERMVQAAVAQPPPLYAIVVWDGGGGDGPGGTAHLVSEVIGADGTVTTIVP